MPPEANSQVGRLRKLTGVLLDLAFPPRCVACNASTVDRTKPDRGFCRTCRDDLKLLQEPLCRRCALPLLSPCDIHLQCPQCKDESWAFDQTIALGSYEGLLRHLVLCAKQASGEQAARVVGAMLASVRAEQLIAVGLNSIVVTPVPSHWTRKMLRRSNSPNWLAEEIARSLKAPMSRLLRRVQRTKRQTEVPTSQRVANVRGAFKVATSVDLTDKTVLLIDDVLTTGATASSAARELKRAGAERVVAVVAARRLGRN